MSFRLYDEMNSYLAIPGPVTLHPRVLLALSRPIYGHRTEEFRRIIAECKEMLKPLFGLRDGDVFILTGSGTCAMDAAVRTFVKPGDKVISFVNGKFSERLAEIAQSCGADVVRVDIEWGKAVKPELVARVLDEHPDAKFVTLTHNETSTAVLNPLPDIAREVRKRTNAIIIADGITSVGGTWVKQEEWGVHIVIGGSQKCLGIPPGLGFVGLTPEMLDLLESGDLKPHAYYTNLKLYLEAWKKEKDLPFTGAVSLFYALHESLRLIHEEGLDARFKRHHTMAEATRRGFLAMGLELLAERGFESPTLTAIKYPSGIKDKEFRSLMARYGILVAGGQARLKGKIFRVSHMNQVGPREVLMVLAVAELVLKQLGFEPKESGVESAIEFLRTAWKP